jgi:peptide/nickel transport system substrate-binding protein
MKIRMAATLAAAMTAVLAVVLAACGGGTHASAPVGSGAIPLLRVGLPDTNSTLDETKNIGNAITGLGLETLLKFGPQGQLEPVLATSWSRTSPTTYVYRLRHAVRFWDGHPLTAADVAYSLNYDRAPGSQVAFAFTNVKNISATGPDTVTVTLTQPDASWQYVPAEDTSYIFEQRFQQAHQTTFGQPGTLVMGSGPWQPESLDPTKGAELSANPHWWGGTVPVRHISFTFYSSETSEALAFRAGEIDVTPEVLGPKSFAAASGATLLTAPSCDNGFFMMNTTQPGWNDVHVRRAAAYALNRTDIIAAHGGYAQPLYTLTPPQLLRSIASQTQISTLLGALPLYQYNLTKARQEMAQSAYPHGFATTILVIVGNQVDVTQVIAAELAKIGIRAQIKQLPGTTWEAAETGPASGRMAAVSEGGCFQPDPGTYSDWLGTRNTQQGSWNVAEYTPPAVNTLLAQGAATTSPAQRFAVYSQLFQRLQADLPYIGLYIRDSVIALSAKFSYANFSQWVWDLPWALNIRPATPLPAPGTAITDTASHLPSGVSRALARPGRPDGRPRPGSAGSSPASSRE